MKIRFFDSIKTQMAILIIIAILMSTGVTSGVIIYINYQNTLNQMKTDGLNLAKSNIANIQGKVAQDNSKATIQGVVENIAQSQNLEYCALISTDYVDVSDSIRQDIGKVYDDADTKAVINNKMEIADFWVDDSGEKILDIMVPVDFIVGNDSIAAVDIGVSVDALNQAIVASIMKSIVISLLSVVVISIIILIFMENIIVKPIRKITEISEKISKGEVDISLDLKSKGEIGKLTSSFNKIINRTKELSFAAQSISRGDLDVEIKVQSPDDVLSNSLRSMIIMIEGILKQTEGIIKEVIGGNLKARANENNFQGSWKNLVGEINDLIDAFVMPINMTAEYVERISNGDIPPKITDTYLGDFNEIKNNLNGCIEVISGIIDETSKLTKSAQEGALNVSSDASLYPGDWGTMLNGINQAVSTIVGHIDNLPSPVLIIDKEYTLKYINKFGASLTGLLPEEILGTKCYDNFKTNDCKTENCACAKAMFQNAKAVSETIARPNGLELEISYTGIPLKDENQVVIGAVELIVDQTEIMKSKRITEKQSKYQSEEVEKLIVNLEKIAKGNLNIETLTGKSDEDTMQITENFMKINLYLNNSVSAIKALIDDAGVMTSAAIEGDLKYRSDTSKHNGSYGEIMAGMNETIDAVTAPIGEALKTLESMKQGNLSVLMEGNYKGEYLTIKETMNETIMNLQSYVQEISSVLAHIGDGNLDLAITADYRGDFVEIKDSLNTILDSLNQVMGDIGEAAEQVTSGSRQVSEGSQTLSQGSSEQASSIQELTASITEIASQTRQNATNAAQANELANEAKENAVKGNNQMKAMLGSMEEINASSANISKIIKVIDDIAFQTNILALNAAVEAARAGQHGKGFAVVAEEVRNLAARSAKAAKETTDLIEGSINKVQGGTKIADETALALADIVSGVENVANIVGGIAEASNKQASGISQINKGIEQVSIVVQNNSATAEESAAASEELFSQAEILKQMVGNFRLKSGLKHLGTEPRHLEPKASKKLTSTKAKPVIQQIILNDNDYDKY